MKTSFKVAVAGVLALVGAQAVALTPTQLQVAVNNGSLVPLYVSGSTVADGIMESLFKLDTAGTRVCQPGSLDIYYFKSASGAISQRALTCLAGFSGTGVPFGAPLALFKESAGGLANGIIYPADSTSLPFIDLVSVSSNMAVTCTIVSSTGSTSPGAAGTFNTRDCGYMSGTPSTVTRSNFVPQAGISDFDPNFFVGSFGVTGTHVGLLVRQRTQLAMTYNPIVSLPLFTVLQHAYGYGSPPPPDLLANVPSLRSSLLRAIFNGSSVLNADEIYVNNTKLSAVNGFDPSGDIYVCRRGNSSATMLAFNAHFLGLGCNRNSAINMTFVAPDDSACATTGCAWNIAYGNDYVFAGAGVSDMRACIDYHSSQGRLAVGLVSADHRPNLTNNRYRYTKVDRVEPTIKAVMDGDYGYFSEFSFNDKYPAVSTSGPQTLWDKLFGYLSTPAVISELNVVSRNAVTPAGPDDGTSDTGLLVVASPASAATINLLYSDWAITGGEARSTPVNTQTRQTLMGTGNNCNLPYQAYP